MTIALGIATVLIALLTSGYNLDRKTGQVIQTGLILVDSHPVSADVLINNEFRGQTDQRLVISEGTYTLELKRAGYRSWQHKVTLEGSSIEQLVYPFLFPEKLVTSPLSSYTSAPSLVSQSPDRRWLVLQDSSKLGQFELIDLSDAKNTSSTLTLPADTFNTAKGDHTFKEVEWSSDNVHLLLEHRYPGGLEYILLDRENPLESLNASKLFPDFLGFELRLRDKKINQFYLFNPKTHSLLRGVSGTTQPTPLLGRVVQYKSYKAETILYVNDKNEVRLFENNQDHLIRTLPNAKNYLLEYAEFNNRFYLVCGSPADGKTYVYSDALKGLLATPARPPQPFRVLIVDKPEFVSFSAISRFIMVQGGSKFAVFDAETSRQFRYDAGLSNVKGQKAIWMDGHRIGLVAGGNLTVFDFDGLNAQTLSAALPGTRPYFNREFDAYFTLSAGAKDVVQLTRTELLVK